MAVDSQRIRRELGFVPRYDLIEGWRETVREMRSADLRNSRKKAQKAQEC